MSARHQDISSVNEGSCSRERCRWRRGGGAVREFADKVLLALKEAHAERCGFPELLALTLFVGEPPTLRGADRALGLGVGW
jgi:hypothetical protein